MPLSNRSPDTTNELRHHRGVGRARSPRPRPLSKTTPPTQTARHLEPDRPDKPGHLSGMSGGRGCLFCPGVHRVLTTSDIGALVTLALLLAPLKARAAIRLHRCQ